MSLFRYRGRGAAQTKSFLALPWRKRGARAKALDVYVGEVAMAAGYDCWMVLGSDETLLWQSAVEEAEEVENLE